MPLPIEDLKDESYELFYQYQLKIYNYPTFYQNKFETELFSSIIFLVFMISFFNTS